MLARYSSLFFVLLCQGFALRASEAAPVVPVQQDLTLEEQSVDVLEEVRVVAPRVGMEISPYIDANLAFGSDAIGAFGVNDLGELLQELGPELGGGRAGSNAQRVILLNGQRIASFSEIRRYPPEALSRVEIYPEDVALQYGFRADQKVVNFVLKSRFRAVTTRFASTGYGETESGEGGEVFEADAGYLSVYDGRRVNLDFDAERQSALHDSDRDVIAPITLTPPSRAGNLFAVGDELDARLSALVGVPVRAATLPARTEALSLDDLAPTANSPLKDDVRAFRTLLAAQDERTLSGGFADLLADTFSATLFGAYTQSGFMAEQGLSSLSYEVPAEHPLTPFDNAVTIERLLPIPLLRESDTRRYEGTGSLAVNVRGWGLTWITTYLQEVRDAVAVQGADSGDFLNRVAALGTDVDPFFGLGDAPVIIQNDTARRTNWSSEFVARGIMADLPTGPLQGSVRFLWQSNKLDAQTRTSTATLRSAIDRQIAGVRVNVEAPLVQDERFGRVSLNVNGEFADYSDFGSLVTLGSGVTWNPSAIVRLTTSFTHEQGVPSMQQLGNPIIRVPTTRTFDFLSGQTLDALEISGGNPALRSELRRVMNVNARIRLKTEPMLTLNLDYSRVRTEDPILRFPNQSAELEAAFPERYIRDARGSLTAIDTRPINLDEERRQEFRWSLNFSKKFATVSTNKKGSPSFRLSLNHTITLEDQLRLAPALVPIDYVGVARAGRPRSGARNTVDLRASYRAGNLSARVNMAWQDASASFPTRLGPLRFDALLRTNLNLVYTFSRQASWVQKLPGLGGSRLRFSIINVFDAKPQVRDDTGSAPVGFSEDELAPRGRHFALEFRKRFS